MSSVHFKFRSGLEYEPLFFDGHCISLKDLREAIITKKKMGKADGFKLEVTDSTTEKEYINDNEMIPKNSSLIVRRVPIFYEKPKEPQVPLRQMDPTELAEIGNIARVAASEEAKLKAIMIQSELVTQNNDEPTDKTLQRVPICFHCKQTGHVIKNCPLIPRQASLGKEPVHLYLKSSLGLPFETAVPRQVEKTVEEHVELPDFFRCPICSSAMENAVLIPCCGTSFCDHCIQNYLIDHNLRCASCQTEMSPEDLVPNLSLRKSLLNFQSGGRGKVTPRSPPKESGGVAVSSQALTAVNIKHNISNSLLSSLPLPGVAFAGSILENLRPFFKGGRVSPKLVPVSAPFLNTQYARSVALGERVLTRDEFYSLKSTLARELRKSAAASRNRHITKSSEQRLPKKSPGLSKSRSRRSRKQEKAERSSPVSKGCRRSRSSRRHSPSPPYRRSRSRSREPRPEPRRHLTRR